MKLLNKILIFIFGFLGIIASLQYYQNHQFDVILQNATKQTIKFEDDLKVEKNINDLFEAAANYNVDIFRVEYKKSELNKNYYNVYLNSQNDNSIINNFGKKYIVKTINTS